MRIGVGILALAASLLAAAASAAEVYRCRADGLVHYADEPCGPGAERITIAEPTTVTPPRHRFQSEPRRPASAPQPIRQARPAPVHTRRNRAPQTDCPSEAAIERAIRRRRVVTCMTPAQVRRATPPRIAGHQVKQDVDQFGPFTEWRYRAVSQGWPARIRFRDGRVLGYETLPYRERD